MAMNIEFDSSNASTIENLLHIGEIGKSKVLYGKYQNRLTYYGFLFTKCKKNLLKVYSIYRGRIHNDNLDKHTAEICKSGSIHGGGKVKWMKPSFDRHHNRYIRGNGSVDYCYRGFLSLGIIQNVGSRWLRSSELWRFKSIETASIRLKDFSFGFNGVFISQVPKECKKLMTDAYEDQRLAKNRNARANYANTSTVAKVRNAKATGDYSKLVPQDVFKLRNVTTRTELIEHYGQDTILDTVDSEVVEKDEIDGRLYELLRFNIPEIRAGVEEIRIATYLKMINPSTGEVCIEGVPNNHNGSRWDTSISMNTVSEALRWRDGDPEEYDVPQALT